MAPRGLRGPEQEEEAAAAEAGLVLVVVWPEEVKRRGSALVGEWAAGVRHFRRPKFVCGCHLWLAAEAAWPNCVAYFSLV